MLEGNFAGPCPRCGGTGRIPDGLFDFIGNTIRVLAGPEQTVDALQRLQVIVEDARQQGIDPRQFADAVEKQVPELGSLVRQLLIPRTAGDFYTFLSFLVAAILLVLSLKQQSPSVTNINIEERVTEVIENCWQDNLLEEPPPDFPSDTEQQPDEDDEASKPDS